MDPVSLIFSLALKNPDLAAKAADSYARPGTVSAAQLESSAADFAREVINCYHHTARFAGLNVVGSPWVGQAQYGAESSAVMQIYFTGVSGTTYEMIVAAMSKGHQYRTAVLRDTALIPYNKNCALERWVDAQGA